jgi:hypothetical protein
VKAASTAAAESFVKETLATVMKILNLFCVKGKAGKGSYKKAYTKVP